MSRFITHMCTYLVRFFSAQVHFFSSLHMCTCTKEAHKCPCNHALMMSTSAQMMCIKWYEQLCTNRMDGACATETINSGSIPNRVKPNTIKKLVFTASLFDVQQSIEQCEAPTVCRKKHPNACHFYPTLYSHYLSQRNHRRLST